MNEESDVLITVNGSGLIDNARFTDGGLQSISDQVFSTPMRVPEGGLPPVSDLGLEPGLGDFEINAILQRQPLFNVQLSMSGVDILRQHGHRVARRENGNYDIDGVAVPVPDTGTTAYLPNRGERVMPKEWHIKDFTDGLEGVILNNLMSICEFAHRNSTNTQAAKALAPLQERIKAFAHILITELTEMEIKINGKKRKIILSDNELDRKIRERDERKRELENNRRIVSERIVGELRDAIELNVREQSIADRNEVGI